MGGLSRKYVVFHADLFDAWYLAGNEVEMPAPIEDAIVLRKQDIFTSSALYEYAGQIRTTIELLERLWRTQDGEGPTPSELIANLRILADQFADEAESAETEFARKIPD